MSRVYRKNSFSVKFDDQDADNIRDVAQALVNQILEQNCKFSIDVVGLLGHFINECGANIPDETGEING